MLLNLTEKMEIRTWETELCQRRCCRQASASKLSIGLADMSGADGALGAWGIKTRSEIATVVTNFKPF